MSERISPVRELQIDRALADSRMRRAEDAVTPRSLEVSFRHVDRALRDSRLQRETQASHNPDRLEF